MKLLPRQLYEKEKSFATPAIKHDKGEQETNTQDINKVFSNFYDHLYKSEVNPEADDYRTFFSNIKLPEMLMNQKEYTIFYYLSQTLFSQNLMICLQLNLSQKYLAIE